MFIASLVAFLFILFILASIFISNRAYKRGVSFRKVLLIQVLSFVFSLFTCSSIAFAVSSGEKGVANSSEQISISGVTEAKSLSANETSSEGDTTNTEKKSSSENSSNSKGLGFIAMALCMGLACLGAGIAVAAAAPAAIGAITEDEKVFGKALIFVAMAEGVTVFGLLISIFIYNGIN
jgi:F0F1-type ATP synthase membrane subunit c/vacuolar-type H+-ATPase subunit K